MIEAVESPITSKFYYFGVATSSPEAYVAVKVSTSGSISAYEVADDGTREDSQKLESDDVNNSFYVTQLPGKTLEVYFKPSESKNFEVFYEGRIKPNEPAREDSKFITDWTMVIIIGVICILAIIIVLFVAQKFIGY